MQSGLPRRRWRRASRPAMVPVESQNFMRATVAIRWIAVIVASASSFVACTSKDVVDNTGTSLCTYPPSPYGLDVGDRLNGNLAWEGYAALEPEASAIEAARYLDCDGSAGVSALQLVQVITDCMTCQRQALELADTLPTDWQSRGIRILLLVARGGSGAPAVLETAAMWRENFGADLVDIAVDPNFTFAAAATNGMPVQVVVEPSTMQIVEVESGYSEDYSVLDSVARSNGR